MASTERLIIEVNEKGALVVKRNLEDVGKGARKAEGALTLLQRALGGLAIGLMVRQLINLADEYTNVQNRLKLVTKDQAELNAVTSELFAVAERTRSSFSATAEMYSRTSLAAKALGKSQAEMLQFTESLNQAITMSGISATEAQAGMVQLSQGLASGALRGDEFRSVSEQMPVVLDVIAKSMGKTRGEMRQMGAEGKITADIVIKAFAEARGELADKFAKTVPTVGQAMTVLKNSFVQLVGGVSEASGATSGLASIILQIAKNIPKLKEPLLVLSDIVLGVFKGIFEVFKAWNDSLVAAGVDWNKVLENLGTGFLALLRTVAQVVDKVIGLVVGLSTALVAAFSTVGTAIGQIASGDWKGAGQTMKEGGQLLVQSFTEGFNQSTLTDIVDTVVGTALDNAAKRRAAVAPKVDLTTKPEGGAAPKPTPEFDKYLRQLQDENKLLQMNSREREIQKELFKAQITMEAEMSPARLKQIEDLLRSNQALGEQATLLEQIRAPQVEYQQGLATLEAIKPQISLAEYNAQFALLKANLEDARPEFDKHLEQLRKEADLLKLSPREAEIQQQVQAAGPALTPEQKAELEAQLRLNQSLAEQAALLDQIQGPQRAYNEGLATLNAIKPEISTAEYNKRLRELKDTLADATNQVNVVGEIWGSVWNGASSALDTFVETGKLSFKDLASSILMDIQKIIGQLLLMKAFQAIGIPIPGFAEGGSFFVGGSGGTDSQTVAFKATPGERVDVSTPAQQRAGEAPAGGGSLNVRIVNVLDPSEITDAMAATDGERVILNVISRNRSTVRQSIS